MPSRSRCASFRRHCFRREARRRNRRGRQPRTPARRCAPPDRRRPGTPPAIRLEPRHRFERAEPIREQDEYRDGYKVWFQSYLGVSRRALVSIDLVHDEVFCGDPVRANPASRLAVEGLLCPMSGTIADKVCAVVELHDGRPSSRIKDLVDLAVIFSTQGIDAGELRGKMDLEARLRRLAPMEAFAIPGIWMDSHRGSFSKLVKEAGLPPRLRSMEAAFEFVVRCLDPVLSGAGGGKRWDPGSSTQRLP